MAFEPLEQHVKQLGGVESSQPLTDAELQQLSSLIGGPLPASLRWWLSTYGADVDFVEPVVYHDARADEDVLVGHFMSVDEIRQTLDDLDGALAQQHLPINDDASGNFIVVDGKGPVSWHIHDAPTDRNLQRIADSFEAFVLMLRRGE